MNDLISRQDAIDAVRFGQSYISMFAPDGTVIHPFDRENDALEDAVDRIAGLSSVTSVPKMGRCKDCKWWMCSECGTTKIHESKYCPGCGSKMEGVEE